MNVEWTPFRWPVSWSDAAGLSLLRGTAINCVLRDGEAVPAGVSVVKGEWAGVRMAQDAGAGPTGVPWVNSNGWAIRLAAAMHPGNAIWVDAAPVGDLYALMMADCAAHGGRWVITLPDAVAAGMVAGNAGALAAWKKICDSAAFFAGHKEWAGYDAQASVGVISDFAGEHEFFGGELLNLLARAGQHTRILVKDKVSDASFAGLRAVIYADAAPAAMRGQILKFVQAGGLLITHANWGIVAGGGEGHPRFALHAVGKGRIAIAKGEQADPYEWANDTAVLVSHRYDLVRFWNGGATGSYYTMSADRKNAIVHLLFYADQGPDEASVRVTGRYRAARIASVGAPVARNVDILNQKDAVEVHLPRVPQYVALELEA